MVIVSLLSDMRWNCVVYASPAGARHERVPDGAGLVAALHEHACGYAVVDPVLAADVPFDTLVLAAATVAVPLLLLGDLTRQAIEACLTAQAVCPTNAQFSDFIDQGWLWFVLHDYASPDVPALVLHHASAAIASLPACIQLPTAALFTGSRIAPSMQAFSLAAGVSRKTIQRWNAYVGLAHPACVLTIARLARVWRLLRSRRLSVPRAASLVGFGSTRTHSRACWRLACCPPASVRDCSDEEFANLLARALLPGIGSGTRRTARLHQKEIHR